MALMASGYHSATDPRQKKVALASNLASESRRTSTDLGMNPLSMALVGCATGTPKIGRWTHDSRSTDMMNIAPSPPPRPGTSESRPAPQAPRAPVEYTQKQGPCLLSGSSGLPNLAHQPIPPQALSISLR